MGDSGKMEKNGDKRKHIHWKFLFCDPLRRRKYIKNVGTSSQIQLVGFIESVTSVNVILDEIYSG